MHLKIQSITCSKHTSDYVRLWLCSDTVCRATNLHLVNITALGLWLLAWIYGMLQISLVASPASFVGDGSWPDHTLRHLAPYAVIVGEFAASRSPASEGSRSVQVWTVSKHHGLKIDPDHETRTLFSVSRRFDAHLPNRTVCWSASVWW